MLTVLKNWRNNECVVLFSFGVCMANLEDVIDVDYGLQQDEWCLAKPRFGMGNQLEVIGWSGKVQPNKRYIVRCDECSKDRSMFGDGLFKTMKGSLLRGVIPCGCAKAVSWSEDQYITRCSRKAEELGFMFIGLEGGFKGSRTKLKILCDKHGEWSTATVNSLFTMAAGCPSCGKESSWRAKSKTDTTVIDSFHKSGSFHPDTKFWRSERKTSTGGTYWWMSCPICGTKAESTSSSLHKGQHPCSCGNFRQKQAYINYIIDDNPDICLALKFGIANKSYLRILDQNRGCIYEVKNFAVWEFPDKQSCLAAELECKRSLQCRVLTKEEMPDGWTETTYLFNLDKIIAIYEKHGGVRMEHA